MNRHGVIEIGLGRAHAHRDRKALHHFIRAHTQGMGTDHALFLTHADQFAQSARLAVPESVIHRHEVSFVDLDRLAMLFAGLRFRQPDGAERWMGEHHRGDVAVIEPAIGHAPIKAVTEAATGGNGHRCQRPAAGDIAKGMDPGRAGRLPFIDGDETALVGGNTGPLQAQVLSGRAAPDRPEQLIEVTEAAPVLAVELVTIPVLLGTGRDRAGDDLDSVLAHLFHQALAQALIEIAQDAVTAHDQLHPCAERGKHAGKLHRDIAAADDADALRAILQLEKTVRGNAELAAGNVGSGRVTPGGYCNVFRAQALAVHGDGACVGQLGVAAKPVHSPGFEVARIDAVEAFDVGLARTLEARPVMAVELEIETIIGGLVHGMRETRRVPHDLLGHAADIDAGAAQALRFDHRGPCTVLGGALGHGQATAAATQCNQVVIAHALRSMPLPGDGGQGFHPRGRALGSGGHLTRARGPLPNGSKALSKAARRRGFHVNLVVSPKETPWMSTARKNPLLEDFDLPPFSRLEAAHFEPAIEQVLAEIRKGIAEIKAGGEPWTWERLGAPLEDLEDRLSRVFAPIGHLNNVANDEAVRAAFNACLERITRHESELGQDRELHDAWQSLRESGEYRNLDTARRKTVDDTLRDFRLSGVALEGADRKRFRDIQEQLSKLQSRFEENVLDATHAWTLNVSDEQRVKGIPQADLDRAAARAEERGESGWTFSLDFPDYFAVLQNGDDRELRREMHQAFMTRASDQGPKAGEYDNGPVMAEIMALRQEAAGLLELDNYAELSLATKMADSPKQVLDFLHDLRSRTRPAAEKEFAELSRFASQELALDSLEPWDVAWASEKLREARFAITDEMLRPWFPLETVLDGMFRICERLYGIRIKDSETVDSWHPDVRFHAITDEAGEPVGQLYLDLFARPGKRGGAWMDECRSRRRIGDSVQTPVAFLTCNFGAPTGDRPALLSHEEVLTLFHEFGHCLQHLLTRVDVADVAGIHGVEWDAVELPSQFQENFAWSREGLDMISGHHESGEKLPEELFQRMHAARNFQSAMKLVRQIEFSLFDMRLHCEYETGRTDIQALLDEVRDETAVVPIAEYDRFAHGFGHVFGGGYAAGYYSYLWAEVLSSDAFGAFEEAGIFDRETGQRFRETVLALGGSRPAAEVFREFRGRDAELDAFLRHHGIGVAA